MLSYQLQMSGLSLPSAAGPMLAPVHWSSVRVGVLKCEMPPTDTTFFAHAWGREFWSPLLLCDWKMGISKSKMIWSISVESDVYCVVRELPQLFDWYMPR